MRVGATGPLAWPPLLHTVCGAQPDARPGRLADGRPALVFDAPPDIVRRIDHHEAVWDRRRAPVGEAELEVEVWGPDPLDLGPPGLDVGDWSRRLDAWARVHAAPLVQAAAEIMDGLGLPPAMLRRYRTNLLRRAEARLRAAAADEDAPPVDVRLEGRTRPWMEWYSIEEARLSHPLRGGGRTAMLPRVWLHAYDVAMGLPWDPARRRVIVTEQFRLAPWAAGKPDPWLREGVAGIVDPGETPAQAAIREAHEEAGVTVREAIPVGDGWPSPGSTTERQFLHLLVCDIADDHPGLGGLRSEGEEITVIVQHEDQLIADAAAGRIRHVPLLAMALALAARRG